MCTQSRAQKLPYSCGITDLLPSVFPCSASPICSLLQWMVIWNHQQPITTALVDPDFDSRLKAWSKMLGYKPYHYHYAVVEAPYPSKADCTSMWSTYKELKPLYMQWMGIWNHWQPVTTAIVVPDIYSGQLKAGITAGLQTIPLCSGRGSIPIQSQSCLHINVKHI